RPGRLDAAVVRREARDGAQVGHGRVGENGRPERLDTDRAARVWPRNVCRAPALGERGVRVAGGGGVGGGQLRAEEARRGREGVQGRGEGGHEAQRGDAEDEGGSREVRRRGGRGGVRGGAGEGAAAY